MNISKIQNTSTFGQISFDFSQGYTPLINKKIWNAMEYVSRNASVNVSSVANYYPFDEDAAIKVSASSPYPGPKFSQVDIYVRPTKENIENKTVIDAIKEAIRLVN